VEWLFVAAIALHAGFQLTVTVVVYPALASVDDRGWRTAHAAHTRRITPLVAVVYGAVLVASVARLVETDARDVATWAAVLASFVAMGLTAFSAGPAHGRLTDRDDVRVARLLRVDRLRCAAVVAALVAALVSVA
jgi:hypothetical protein